MFWASKLARIKYYLQNAKLIDSIHFFYFSTVRFDSFQFIIKWAGNDLKLVETYRNETDFRIFSITIVLQVKLLVGSIKTNLASQRIRETSTCYHRFCYGKCAKPDS